MTDTASYVRSAQFPTDNASWWFKSAASWARIESFSDAPYRHAYDDLQHAHRWLHQLMGYRSDHGNLETEF